VGLKPDPTLHPTQHPPHNNRHQDQRGAPIGNRHVGNNSTTANHSRPRTVAQPALLHSKDFPPLSNSENRPPAVTGAWINSVARSSVMLSTANHQHASLNSKGPGSSPDLDRGFDRPPPRATELYNPKKTAPSTTKGSSEVGEKINDEILRGVGSISLQEQASESLVANPVIGSTTAAN
jgi:hypothetical protein